MNKNTKEDCEMKKEEYLSLIDEVIAQGPYTDTLDSLCEHPTPKWYADFLWSLSHTYFWDTTRFLMPEHYIHPSE